MWLGAGCLERQEQRPPRSPRGAVIQASGLQNREDSSCCETASSWSLVRASTGNYPAPARGCPGSDPTPASLQALLSGFSY